MPLLAGLLTVLKGSSTPLEAERLMARRGTVSKAPFSKHASERPQPDDTELTGSVVEMGAC